jgi:FixJ family two-component response regulator
MSQPVPTVYVVDDEPSVLKSVGRLLRSAGLNAVTFASARDFLDHHDPDAPGCLLLDVSMPELTGLELQQTLSAMGCERPIIFLTGRGDIPMSVKAMKQGAADFLTKPVDEGVLLEAVRGAMEKDRAAGLKRAELAEVGRRLAALTPREREVLEQVVCGKLNKQIAAELGTVEKTIKVHRAHIMEKLKVRSVAELVRLVARVDTETVPRA